MVCGELKSIRTEITFHQCRTHVGHISGLDDKIKYILSEESNKKYIKIILYIKCK
ncbi:MAG: hypothetical protein JWP81_1362 [Ferruginibacter sp.]|nr:hypothetical protein [Ferruginibacter sp.]